jgi:hypothetical protein
MMAEAESGRVPFGCCEVDVGQLIEVEMKQEYAGQQTAWMEDVDRRESKDL